ncbi:MAG TPA: hypothetical protein VIF09_21880 [Polyangiaceae bacterium]
MKRARLAVAMGLVALVAIAPCACAKGKDDASVLAAQDLTASGGPFDPNEILALAPMQDALSLDGAAVQQFLQQTPYGTPSFLAAYSSNGVPASQAVVAAALRYDVNPIVLLVHAEMDQGLVAATSYPSPASRVDYAFGCGCSAVGDCDPAYAGFDLQVACLASTLRDYLDQVAATGSTAGGWGPGSTVTTLDGVGVDPDDDSTAALYQYTPVVAVGKAGGNWLFWNVWQLFAGALGYAAPDGGSSSTAWIGDVCTGAGNCIYEGTPGTCATQFPGGLCTLACQGSCPSSSAEAQTFCADFGSEGGFCLAVCNPADPQCRTGYTCESVKEFGDTATSQYVCFPK